MTLGQTRTNRPRGGRPSRRLAAIDIGSNAIRFAAAEVDETGGWTKLARHRMPVRLGQSAFLEGRLSPGIMERALEALGAIRRQLDALGVDRVRAVATSAVRESANGDRLVARALDAYGLRIDAITGREEARLVWRAVRDRLPLTGRWSLADLGGGSLELSVVSPDGIEWSESYPVGTVRLLAASREPGGDSETELADRAAEAVRAIRFPSHIDLSDTGGLIATGGNIEALAKLAKAREVDGVLRLSRSALGKTRRRLEALTFDQRIDRLGLRTDRADVIVPAGRVYEAVAVLAKAREIIVPRVGVMDGVLAELASLQPDL